MIETPSLARRERLAELVALDVDIAVADTASSALQELQEPTDVVVFRATERKLAIQTIIRAALALNHKTKFLAFGELPSRGLEVPAAHTASDDPGDLAAQVRAALGMTP